MTNIIKQIEALDIRALISWRMKTTAPPWRATLSTVLRESSTSRVVLELTTVAAGELHALLWKVELNLTTQRGLFRTPKTVAFGSNDMLVASAGEAADAASAALIHVLREYRETMRELFDFADVAPARSDLIDLAQAATRAAPTTSSTKGATIASVNGERDVSELIRRLRANVGLNLRGRRKAWPDDLDSEGHRLAQRAVARLMLKLRSERFTVAVPFNVLSVHLDVNDSRLRDLVHGAAPRPNGIRSSEADALGVPFAAWAQAPTSDI